jgi:hypothetical protein
MTKSKHQELGVRVSKRDTIIQKCPSQQRKQQVQGELRDQSDNLQTMRLTWGKQDVQGTSTPNRQK